ncbi:hypothetical protein HK099_002027, partial [Clydaea vesicula]
LEELGTLLAVGEAINNNGAKAVYTQTNDPNGNSVIAHAVLSNGKIDINSIKTFNTEGNGGQGLDAEGNPQPIDPLFSQGAITRGGLMLFAVNAGSNTLSMFNINPNDPTSLTLAGKPQNTLGEFPVSVAFSEKLQTACVVNGGKLNGISCFKANKDTGLTPLDNQQRPLEINTLSTPPVGPLGTVSHILFSPDSSNLFVTVKGNPEDSTAPLGFLGSFPVVDGKVSSDPIRKSTPNGSVVLFGSAFSGDNTFIATDAGFGAITLDIDPATGSANASSTTKVDGQVATCWAAFNKNTQTTFITDIGQPSINEVNAQGDIINTLNLEGVTGMIDIAASNNNFVYSLAPTESSLVVSQSLNNGLQQEQVLKMNLDNGLTTFMGMVVFQ